MAAGWPPGLPSATRDRVERLVLVDPARLSFESEEASSRFFDRIREGLGPFKSDEEALAWGSALGP